MQSDLDVREARLERENKRLRLVGILCILGLAGAILMGQAKTEEIPELIKAQAFSIVDKEGNSRGGLVTDVMGGAPTTSLILTDAKRTRVMLTQFDGGPLAGSRLTFIDENGKYRLVISYDEKDGEAWISVLKPDGTTAWSSADQ